MDTLIWSDEFDGADGTAPDPEKWVLETGNNEIFVDEAVRVKALRSTQRMLDFSAMRKGG